LQIDTIQIITHLLKLYDAQRNLIIVVNATPSDEAGLAEDLSNLGVRRPGLVQVGYEMNAKQRSVWTPF
jgi:DNA excision repair protein ERCC-4